MMWTCFVSFTPTVGAAVMSVLPGTGPVFVEGLLCEGSENKILECNTYAIPLHLVCLLLAVS